MLSIPEVPVDNVLTFSETHFKFLGFHYMVESKLVDWRHNNIAASRCISYLILDVMFRVSARLNVPGCVIAVIGGGEYGAGRIEYIIVGLCCIFHTALLCTIYS